MNTLSSTKGILFNLDGVLYASLNAIEGGIEAIGKIRGSGIQCHFVTNTSTLSLTSLHNKIQQLGFLIPENEIISAP